MTNALQTEIIRENLELMVLGKAGGMANSLHKESMGGNAGYTRDGHPCRGANFHFDRNTGEIIYFGNCQNVPATVKTAPQNAEGTFRIAINLSRQWRSEIVEAIYRPARICEMPESIASTPYISDSGRYVLLETIKAYNKIGKAGNI